LGGIDSIERMEDVMKMAIAWLVLGAAVLSPALSEAADMSSASYTLRGASLNGGGGVGMVSTLPGTTLGTVGATLGQGGPPGIGENGPLTLTLEAGVWPVVASLSLPVVDSDGDGVPDSLDNCIQAANPSQLDTDGDGIGNMCDCDFNNDNFCGGPDFTLFIGCFNGATGTDATCQAADMNGDGFVGGPDFTAFIGLFNGPPGPAAP